MDCVCHYFMLVLWLVRNLVMWCDADVVAHYVVNCLGVLGKTETILVHKITLMIASCDICLASWLCCLICKPDEEKI